MPYAGWLHERLIARFGEDQVFMDVSSIKPGFKFTEAIDAAVSECEVLLALIGPQWLTITDEAGNRRLDDPEDIVSLEIGAGLQRDVRVIPILVDGAKMPTPNELPKKLVKLAGLQAITLRGESFDRDVSWLINAIGSIMASVRMPAESTPSKEAIVARSHVTNTRGSVAQVLDRFTLRAWLPVALFAVSMAFLLQFRSARSVNITSAVRALPDSAQLLVLAISLVVVAIVVTQVLSLGAVRALEGYWHRRGLATLVRTLTIRRHVRRKSILSKRRERAYWKAFRTAMPGMIQSGIPASVIKAIEAQILSEEPVSLSAEEYAILSSIEWRNWCDSWRLVKLDRLLDEELAYPASSRVLPTKLGNLIRATEDGLRNTNEDLQSFILQRYAAASYWVQRQYDQSRNRLELYCTLVFVNALIAILTPIILLGRGIGIVAITIISGTFVILSAISYRAAIVSAEGYCATLREIDEASA